MRRLLLALMLLTGLAACETSVPMHRLPEMGFGHLPPIRFAASRIDVTSEYKAPMQDPYVEHLMPVSPEAAVRRWAQDRLQATGGPNSIQVVIKDAKVVESKLNVEKGISGKFKDQQSERYDASLDVMINARNERGLTTHTVSARSSRYKTVPESISLNDREKIWYEMVEALMGDINAQLESNIREYMGLYLQ